MGKVRWKWNMAGFRTIRTTPGVQADLARRAQRIASAAGPGMEASSMVGAARARASVITANGEAKRAEATDRALTRAIDSGR